MDPVTDDHRPVIWKYGPRAMSAQYEFLEENLYLNIVVAVQSDRLVKNR